MSNKAKCIPWTVSSTSALSVASESQRGHSKDTVISLEELGLHFDEPYIMALNSTIYSMNLAMQSSILSQWPTEFKTKKH